MADRSDETQEKEKKMDDTKACDETSEKSANVDESMQDSTKETEGEKTLEKEGIESEIVKNDEKNDEKEGKDSEDKGGKDNSPDIATDKNIVNNDGSNEQPVGSDSKVEQMIDSSDNKDEKAKDADSDPPVSQTPSPTVGDKANTPRNGTPTQNAAVADNSNSQGKSTPTSQNAASTATDSHSATPSSRSTPVDTPKNKTPKATATNKKTKVSRVLDQSGSSDDFRPMAQLLFDLGMDLTRQTVYKDLIRIQKKKEGKGKLDEKEKEQLERLGVAYSELALKNDTFIHETSSCKHCGFKTDSANIMTAHMEYAHDQHLGVFTCVLCDSSNPKSILPSAAQFMYHMESVHQRRGRTYSKHSFYVCTNCQYESNNSTQFQKHQDRCSKSYNSKTNLAPNVPDKDIPLLASRAPQPKKVVPPKPRPTTPRFQMRTGTPTQSAAMMASINMAVSNAMNRAPTPTRAPVPVAPTPNIRAQIHSRPIRPPVTPAIVARPNAPSPTPPAPQGMAGTPLVQMNGQMYKLAVVNGQQFLVPVNDVNAANVSQGATTPAVVHKPGGGKSTAVPSPSTAAAISRPALSHPKVANYEVCEICGGFVQDREALRVHFIWAHKVHIHKDVFKNKLPPLMCPTCRSNNVRFWTNQGLVKHREDGHRSNPNAAKSPPKTKRLIDEIAKNCIYCLEEFKSDITPKLFWMHMSIHGISPASIFRTNKCCACGTRILDFNAMNQHLAGKHALLFSNSTFTAAPTQPKPPIQNQKKTPNKDKPSPSNSKTASNSSTYKNCKFCNFRTVNPQALNRHISTMHPVKCSRCTKRFGDLIHMNTHFNSVHSQEKDECPICKTKIKIGRAFVRHMKSEHMKDCSVVLQGLPKSILIARKEEIDTVLDNMTRSKHNSGSKRRRETPKKSTDNTPKKNTDKVIMLEDGSPRKKKSRANSKEVLEVDGEEIVVELQNDDEDEATKQTPPRPKLTNGVKTEDDMGLKITSTKSIAGEV